MLGSSSTSEPAKTFEVSMGGIAWGFTLPGQGGYDRIVGGQRSPSSKCRSSPPRPTTRGSSPLTTSPPGSDATFVLEHDEYPLAHVLEDTYGPPRPTSQT